MTVLTMISFFVNIHIALMTLKIIQNIFLRIFLVLVLIITCEKMGIWRGQGTPCFVLVGDTVLLGT
jgi:hypothetical protein